jgi:hypothetical protein
MAKIVITIEDNDNGRVRVKSTPSCQDIAGMAQSGDAKSPAYGYAVALLNRALDISQMEDDARKKGKIIQPFT